MRNFSSRFYWLQKKLMVSMAKTFSSVRIQTTQILSEIIFALLIKVSLRHVTLKQTILAVLSAEEV